MCPPQMDERGLLADAIKQLDELFLLVVVGEFNSGKSSVINALLGGRFLEEGILPTTNEISVLKFAEHEDDVGTVQNADGFYVSIEVAIEQPVTPMLVLVEISALLS